MWVWGGSVGRCLRTAAMGVEPANRHDPTRRRASRSAAWGSDPAPPCCPPPYPTNPTAMRLASRWPHRTQPHWAGRRQRCRPTGSPTPAFHAHHRTGTPAAMPRTTPPIRQELKGPGIGQRAPARRLARTGRSTPGMPGDRRNGCEPAPHLMGVVFACSPGRGGADPIGDNGGVRCPNTTFPPDRASGGPTPHTARSAPRWWGLSPGPTRRTSSGYRPSSRGLLSGR